MKRVPEWVWWVAGGLVLLVAVPGGAVVVTKVVTDRATFLRQIAGEIARQLEELRPDLSPEARREAGRIVAAQAAHETGFGKAVAWREGWNFGNVTAGASWTGPVVLGGDTEPDASGRYVKITQRFRKYASLGESVSDFLRLLSWPRYRAARDALFRGDLDTYALRLRDDDPATVQIEGGYYTAPLASYTAGLRALYVAAKVAA